MGLRSEPQDAQFIEMMNEAQEMFDKAMARVDDAPAVAMAWAQLATAQVLAAIARDLTEIRARMQR